MTFLLESVEVHHFALSEMAVYKKNSQYSQENT